MGRARDLSDSEKAAIVEETGKGSSPRNIATKIGSHIDTLVSNFYLYSHVYFKYMLLNSCCKICIHIIYLFEYKCILIVIR